MSSHDADEEPMDTSSTNDLIPKPLDEIAEKDECEVTLSLKWSKDDAPPQKPQVALQKPQVALQKVLQTWFNKCEPKRNCTILNISGDGRAVIRIEPAPGVRELQKLNGATLNRKDVGSVTITSINLTLEQMDTQIPEDASMNPSASSVSEPKDVEQSYSSSSAGALSAEKGETRTCPPIPVGLFWYVNHVYQEEMTRLEKENGVKVNGEVNVTFTADREDGNPEKALAEFTELVQKYSEESEGKTFPLKDVDPDHLKGALKFIQRKESKLLLTLSFQEGTVCGPTQSQEALHDSLKFKHGADASSEETAWDAADTAPSIDMHLVKDPLADDGLTLDEGTWRQMNTITDQVARIKTKFGVDLKVSVISQDLVQVKACYKKSGGNPSMESHALRALLRLYQKTIIPPMSFNSQPGATGGVGQWDGASGGPVSNGGGATAAREEEDDKCPICLDAFIDKKRLNCKHEFCDKCLTNSKIHSGPVCPVCRKVFGLVEGNQPEGKMTWTHDHFPLPGFPNCGSITINYNIPSGIQTERHPNPGQYFSSIYRTAYLPDNQEGNEVLHLLKKAFDQKLIFTVGTSRTTGCDNQVTWNDIHHKTSTTGGPQNFGYPDPYYLSRVKEELKAKGIE